MVKLKKKKTWWKMLVEGPQSLREELIAFSGPFRSTGSVEVPEGMWFFFPSPAAGRSFTNWLQSRYRARVRTGQMEPVPEENWNRNWMEHFTFQRITRRLVIVPPWEEYRPAAGERWVTIYPGMAFGTGTHETTRLVLKKLSTLRLAGRTVLDFGCGSGILTIAAVSLGARSGLGIDTDPIAVAESKKNAHRNRISGKRIRFVHGTTGSLPALPFDVILANIQSSVLIPRLPWIHKHCRPSGLVIFSGILREEESDFLLHLKKTGFHKIRVTRKKDWIALSAIPLKS